LLACKETPLLDSPDFDVHRSRSNSLFETSVTRLRKRERAYSRREFVARGSRSVRCEHCLLAETACICSQRPAPVNGVAVCLLYYKGEVFKPSNTGRLIADVLADNYAYLWTRAEPEPELAALLSNNTYAPLLVFPKEYASPERQLNESGAINTYINGRIPLLIFLDGTWREARKMFRSRWLANVPVVSIDPAQASQYLLRVAAHEHQLGTAEVAVPVLESLGYTTAAQALSEYFSLFCLHYLLGKATHNK
jgi:DTW domain-containing protein YfiP